MKLSVISIDRQVVRVEAEGEITMRDFDADGRDHFETLLGAGWASQKVVLDCSNVNYVDSSAIGWLMTCRREFDRKGGLFLLHSIQPRVRQVLDLLRVGKALPLLPNEAAAMAVAAASVKGKGATQPYPTELDVAIPSAPPAAAVAPVPAPAAAPAPTSAAADAAAPARKPRKPKAEQPKADQPRTNQPTTDQPKAA